MNKKEATNSGNWQAGKTPLAIKVDKLKTVDYNYFLGADNYFFGGDSYFLVADDCFSGSVSYFFMRDNLVFQL